MKILIRHRVYQRYLDHENQWVAKSDTARDFMHGDLAIAHAAAIGLRSDIDLAYHFSNPAFNFHTPLDAFGHARSKKEQR